MKIVRGEGTSLRHVRNTIAFDGSAGNGAVGTVAMFTVTGTVWIAAFMAECTENLTEGGATATIAVGVSGVTTELLAAVDAVDLDNTELWTDGLISGGILQAAAADIDVICKADIFATVAVDSVDDGTLVFDLWYRPVTDNGAVVSA